MLWKTQKTCSPSAVQSLFCVACCFSNLACLSSHRNMGQQGPVIYRWRREKKISGCRWTEKYRGRRRVFKCRCVKVTIQPRRSSKHAVITPLSQKFSLLIHVRRKKKQIAECSCHIVKLPLALISDLMWSFSRHHTKILQISQEVWAVTLLFTITVFAQDFSFGTLQVSSCKQHSGCFIVQYNPCCIKLYRRGEREKNKSWMFSFCGLFLTFCVRRAVLFFFISLVLFGKAKTFQILKPLVLLIHSDLLQIFLCWCW